MVFNRACLVLGATLALAGATACASSAQRVVLRTASDAGEIEVKFTALTAQTRAPRATHLVAEQQEMPVQNILLGDLWACCEGECNHGELRESLRVAAGRVGASDVVGVRCLHKGEDLVCSARATAPSADPRVTAAAR